MIENLNDMMIDFGFTDFNMFSNKNKCLNKNINLDINYYSFINENSLNLINAYYDNDFKYFDYVNFNLL